LWVKTVTVVAKLRFTVAGETEVTLRGYSREWFPLAKPRPGMATITCGLIIKVKMLSNSLGKAWKRPP